MKTRIAKLLMEAGVSAVLVMVAAGAVFAQSDTKPRRRSSK